MGYKIDLNPFEGHTKTYVISEWKWKDGVLIVDRPQGNGKDRKSFYDPSNYESIDIY